MSRSWKAVRADAAAEGHLSEQRVAAVTEVLRAQVRAHQLAEVRKG